MAGLAAAGLLAGAAAAEDARAPAAFAPGGPALQRLPPVYSRAVPLPMAPAFSDAVQPGPQVGRYFSADGNVAFVLDVHGGMPLLRFDHSPEVLVLRSVPAPRGDLVLKTDVGRTVLRLTPYGALTVFPADSSGVPVLWAGGAGTLFGAPISLAAIAATADRLTAELSERLGAPVAVRVSGSDGLADHERVIVYQALENCGVAFRDLSRAPLTRQALAAAVRAIRLEPAPRPELAMEGGTFLVRVTPSLAALGWASSAAIEDYLLGAL